MKIQTTPAAITSSLMWNNATSTSNTRVKYYNKRDLCFVTWNVRGIMSSAASLSQLLDENNVDVVFTEHKLFEHSKSFCRLG
jgi:hypothetical protein